MSDLGFTRASEAATYSMVRTRINLVMAPTPDDLSNKAEILGIGVLFLQLICGVDLLLLRET